MSIVCGDVVAVQRNPKKKSHNIIANVTHSETVHTVIAISPERCLEMHLGGLRIVKIARYKKMRILRPPVILRSAINHGIDVVYGEYKWARYSVWQGVCQVVKAKFGFWLPFGKKNVGNCSEVTARYAEVIGTVGVNNENSYFPGKIVDHLLIKGWLEQEEVHN